MSDSPIVALYVGDGTVVDPQIRGRIDEAMPAERQALDLDVLRPPERGPADAVASLRQVGMFSAGRFVWLRGWDGSAKDAGDDVDQLVATLEARLCRGNALFVSAPTMDRRSRVYRWFRANAELHDCRVATDRYGRMDQGDIENFVSGRLETAGISVRGRDVAREIVRRSGGGAIGELVQEIERLALVLGEGEALSADLVKEHMRDLSEAWVFDLTDAIAARRLADAEAVTERLLGAGEAPLRLVATIGGQVASLVDARRAAGALGRSELGPRMGDFMKQAYPKLPEGFRKRYTAGRAYHLLKAATRFSETELRGVHRALADLDLGLKGGSMVDAGIQFHTFLTRVCIRR